MSWRKDQVEPVAALHLHLKQVQTPGCPLLAAPIEMDQVGMHCGACTFQNGMQKRRCHSPSCWLQMEMDEEEKQLVADATAPDGAPPPDAAPDAAPPVPQDEDDDDDMLVRLGFRLLQRLPFAGHPGSCLACTSSRDLRRPCLLPVGASSLRRQASRVAFPRHTGVLVACCRL